MTRNLVATFESRAHAEEAAAALTGLGVRRTSIRIVAHDPSTVCLLATVDEPIADEAVRLLEQQHPRSVEAEVEREQVRVRSWPSARPMEPMHGHMQRELGQVPPEPADTEERRTHFADWERDWHLHYDEHAGLRRMGFRDVQPAYHLGMRLAEDPTWRDRSWSEVEPHARRLWEAEHRSMGSWDRVRDAVEHAWRRYDVVF